MANSLLKDNGNQTTDNAGCYSIEISNIDTAQNQNLTFFAINTRRSSRQPLYSFKIQKAISCPAIECSYIHYHPTTISIISADKAVPLETHLPCKTATEPVILMFLQPSGICQQTIPRKNAYKASPMLQQHKFIHLPKTKYKSIFSPGLFAAKGNCGIITIHKTLTSGGAHEENTVHMER